MAIDVSCIIPVKDGEKYLRECFFSILKQCLSITYEVCIFDDGSCDGTADIISEYSILFQNEGIPFKTNRGELSGGVGYSKNEAVKLSSGRFLCFCDADDINSSERLQRQFEACLRLFEPENCIVGAQFSRLPVNSTPRYTQWACSLSEEQLQMQIYTSFGPTVVAPTWFLSRVLYDRIGGFDEKHKVGFPEDLDFFYRALQNGTTVHKVDEILVIYRHHLQCSTHAVSEQIIWNMRIKELERNVLSAWSTFTIWNAGKQGKRLFRSLSAANREKVSAMCDVDEKKITRGSFEVYDEQLRKITHSIPIVGYRDSRPPVIICVKLNMTGGLFEQYLAEKKWREDIDFVHFN